MTSLTLDPENEIELWTKNGPCRIQLMSGSITTLPMEDKVDIVMVSAFPGDYAPLPRTVIGALKNDLDISVRDLAFEKEIDLRHLFSCWMSKTITTPNSPFKRLLCFERSRKDGLSIVEQVSQMFRVFVPVFNNQDNTIITPLLATGSQRQNEYEICETMIIAGAHWINAGLPLRCLKIVIYGSIDSQMSQMFQVLKKKLLAKNLKLKNQITKKMYDIYVSFHPQDESKFVNPIVKQLKSKQEEIKVFSSLIKFDHLSVWQDKIFVAMVSSKRIIVVLTSNFLESKECLEQYNMAICCNKLMGGGILAPFYLESIPSLPSYMTLVQWIDCRERKEGDNTMLKIQSACSTVVTSLDEKQGGLNAQNDETKPADKDKYKHDVFISYSHKNPQQAETLLKLLKDRDDSMNVFFDRSSLTTGSNWQRMLYESMGQSKVAVALLSPSYLSSVVCQEEYNLALARFLFQDQPPFMFVSQMVEQMTYVPNKVVPASPYREGMLELLAETVHKSLTHDAVPTPSQKPENIEEAKMNMNKMMSKHRTANIRSQYKFEGRNNEKGAFVRVKPIQITQTEEISGPGTTDVVMCFSNESNYLASILCSLIDNKFPFLKINTNMGQTLERLGAMDTANVIVMLISKEFITTESHMHELYLALSRQRSSKRKILYLILKTPLGDTRPFFPQILDYDLAIFDPIWNEFGQEFKKAKVDKKDDRKMVITSDKNRVGNANYFSCSFNEYFALTKATDDVLDLVLDLRENETQPGPLLLNLLNLETDLQTSTEENLLTTPLQRVPGSTVAKTDEPDKQSETKDGAENPDSCELNESDATKDIDQESKYKNAETHKIGGNGEGADCDPAEKTGKPVGANQNNATKSEKKNETEMSEMSADKKQNANKNATNTETNKERETSDTGDISEVEITGHTGMVTKTEQGAMDKKEAVNKKTEIKDGKGKDTINNKANPKIEKPAGKTQSTATSPADGKTSKSCVLL